MFIAKEQEVLSDVTKEELDIILKEGIINICTYVDISDKENVARLKELGFVKVDLVENIFSKHYNMYRMEYRGNNVGI